LVRGLDALVAWEAGGEGWVDDQCGCQAKDLGTRQVGGEMSAVVVGGIGRRDEEAVQE